MNDFAARCRPTSYGVGSVRSRSENDAMPDGVGRCRTGNPSVYYCYVTLYTWVFYYLFDVYPPKFKYLLCKRTDGVAASDLSRAWTFFCRSGKKSHVAVRQAPYGKSCTWTPGLNVGEWRVEHPSENGRLHNQNTDNRHSSARLPFHTCVGIMETSAPVSNKNNLSFSLDFRSTHM